MPLVDREALRALVLLVVERMKEDDLRRRQQRQAQRARVPVIEPDTTPAIQLVAEEEAILDVVMEAGEATTGAIAEELGMDLTRVSKRVQRMRVRGLLEVVGYARGNGVNTRQTIWRVTRRGERAAVMPNPEVWQTSRTRKEVSA